MSNQVLAGHNFPEDGDAEALAHIWWTYAQEANQFDHRRISHLHKSLDVRLIFVRTTFINCGLGMRRINKAFSLVYFQRSSHHSLVSHTSSSESNLRRNFSDTTATPSESTRCGLGVLFSVSSPVCSPFIARCGLMATEYVYLSSGGVNVFLLTMQPG
jgi:hypothetical protein